MAGADKGDVQEFIDKSPISRYQGLIIALCFLVVALDGFDTAAIGFIAPALRTEYMPTTTQFAFLFGSGLLGLMFGAFLFGPLADRYGRKVILIACVTFFGIGTAVSSAATSIDQLTVLRFLTGLGLGGAMPNAITLTAEYCPRRHRSFLVTLMFCGFTIGSASGGLLVAHVVTDYGWRPVLLMGGLLPLFLAPLLLAALPESARFLATRGGPPEKIRRILRRIRRCAEVEAATFERPALETKSPVAQLIAPAFLASTLLLWLTFFMSLLIVYLVTNWLPLIVSEHGVSLEQASLITAMFQVGGTVGAVALGRLMDKRNPQYVLAAAYGAGVVFIILIGQAATAPMIALLAVFGAGFCISGSQVGLNALSASIYPTASRATGVSWSNAVGRSGSILGATVGGVMLAMNMSMPLLFLLISIPAAIASTSLLVLSGVSRRREAEGARQPARAG